MTGAVAALRAELEAQVSTLHAEGAVAAPHAYVQVWTGLRRWQQQGGWRPLPGAGGWLDQDAELCWALDLCDAAWNGLEAVRVEQAAALERMNAPDREALPVTGPSRTFSLTGPFE